MCLLYIVSTCPVTESVTPNTGCCFFTAALGLAVVIAFIKVSSELAVNSPTALNLVCGLLLCVSLTPLSELRTDSDVQAYVQQLKMTPHSHLAFEFGE